MATKNEQLKESAYKEMLAFKLKYEMLEQLVPVFDAIDVVTEGEK